MVSNSMRRKGRNKWRYFLGLSVLGFLIIASASHAGERPPVGSGAAAVEAASRSLSEPY
jgi:hypothetical protein